MVGATVRIERRAVSQPVAQEAALAVDLALQLDMVVVVDGEVDLEEADRLELLRPDVDARAARRGNHPEGPWR
jgi:hypothetical protein